jgi:hypothetical protein
MHAANMVDPYVISEWDRKYLEARDELLKAMCYDPIHVLVNNLLSILGDMKLRVSCRNCKYADNIEVCDLSAYTPCKMDEDIKYIIDALRIELHKP